MALRDDRTRQHILLKHLLQPLPDPVWLKDRDGLYLPRNARFEELFGAAEAQIPGRTDYDLISKPVDADKLHEKRLEWLAAADARP